MFEKDDAEFNLKKETDITKKINFDLNNNQEVDDIPYLKNKAFNAI
jgi:hypothetical protein